MGLLGLSTVCHKSRPSTQLDLTTRFSCDLEEGYGVYAVDGTVELIGDCVESVMKPCTIIGEKRSSTRQNRMFEVQDWMIGNGVSGEIRKGRQRVMDGRSQQKRSQ